MDLRRVTVCLVRRYGFAKTRQGVFYVGVSGFFSGSSVYEYPLDRPTVDLVNCYNASSYFSDNAKPSVRAI